MLFRDKTLAGYRRDRVIAVRHTESMAHLRSLAKSTILGLFVSAAIGFAALALRCPEYGQPETLGTVTSILLAEVSGLAVSELNEGVIWAHNDSGDEARVYAMDPLGRLLAVWRFPEVEAIDCEDMAIGPWGDRGTSHLFLADIGDNARTRDRVRIYIAPEPHVERVSDPGECLLGSVEILEAVYPDGPHDAETLLVDPLTGELYLLTKGWTEASVYRIPSGKDDRPSPGVMEAVARIPFALATGGDVSSDGTQVLVRGYWSVMLWSRSARQPLWTAFHESGCALPFAIEPQGEAIAFLPCGTAYITLSEGHGEAIYRFEQRREAAAQEP